MAIVLQTVPLGMQWPTVDPFLFCVHHLDHYPVGNERRGPNASLAGRAIGQDFEGVDGWRMYHGSVVPGFPAHPHRGFETVTYVRRGLVDHSDSLGAAARYGRGDVQWMTAGKGIVHAEMFPLLDRQEPNTLELFQIWVNLPARHKMVDPHFSMLWDHDIERVVVDDGARAEITVIAGAIPVGGSTIVTAPAPPPHSRAADPESDLAIWHLSFESGAHWTLPAAAADDTVRVVYLFGDQVGDRGHLTLAGEMIATGYGAVIDARRPVEVVAHDGPVEALVLQGRPIGEPVARYGPFVMNTEDEIRQAFEDYRRTGFGGWPWPIDDHTHGDEHLRFARHADGRVEEVTPV